MTPRARVRVFIFIHVPSLSLPRSVSERTGETNAAGGDRSPSSVVRKTEASPTGQTTGEKIRAGGRRRSDSVEETGWYCPTGAYPRAVAAAPDALRASVYREKGRRALRQPPSLAQKIVQRERHALYSSGTSQGPPEEQ